MLTYTLEKARQIPYIKGQSRVYSVLVDVRGRIISESANNYLKTHTKMAKASKKLGLCKEYLHSECSTIIKDKNRKGVKLYVARVNAAGDACAAFPCLVCQAILKDVGYIKSIEVTL